MANLPHDFDYLDKYAGADGDLKASTHQCAKMNDALTTFLDDFLGGPDKVDAFDSSCNTCKDFQRLTFDRKERNPAIYGFPGTCARDGLYVLGWPRGQYCGHSCYANRRTGDRGPQVGFFNPEAFSEVKRNG